MAQLFIITPEALTGMGKVTAAGDTTKRCLEQYPVGGMIYFAGNIEDRQQLSDMLHTTQSYSTEQSGIPIFLSVDEEGGTVARVAGSGISNVSVVEDMCEVTDEERAYEIGQTIGNYLAELGFNLDYAPVGDVLTNPENTVVKKRSFGNDSAKVAALSQKVLDGLHEENVYGVIKHFPGMGQQPEIHMRDMLIQTSRWKNWSSRNWFLFRMPLKIILPLLWQGIFQYRM